MSAPTNPPDWDALSAIVETAQAEFYEGTLTRARYNELWAKARIAVAGHDEFLEALSLYDPQ